MCRDLFHGRARGINKQMDALMNSNDILPVNPITRNNIDNFAIIIDNNRLNNLSLVLSRVPSICQISRNEYQLLFIVRFDSLNSPSCPSSAAWQGPVGRLVASKKTVREASIRTGKFACRRALPCQFVPRDDALALEKVRRLLASSHEKCDSVEKFLAIVAANVWRVISCAHARARARARGACLFASWKCFEIRKFRRFCRYRAQMYAKYLVLFQGAR